MHLKPLALSLLAALVSCGQPTNGPVLQSAASETASFHSAAPIGPEQTVLRPLALLGNAVVAWGNNEFGQTNVPAGLTNVTAITASSNYSLALKADGMKK